jgi:hypothetical protein
MSKGSVTRITYVVRSGVSAAEVFGSHRAELIARGLKPLYEAKGVDLGRSRGNLYQNIAGQLLEYSPKRAHFLSAKLDSVPATTYVTLYVTEYELGATSVRALARDRIKSLMPWSGEAPACPPSGPDRPTTSRPSFA